MSGFSLYAFTGLGLMAFGALAMAILAWLGHRRLEKRLAPLFAGKDGKDLEEALRDLSAETKELDREIQDLYEISNRLRGYALKSLHKTAVLRYNPFDDVGSNQSFAVAFLDGRNSGLVLSSLHTREGTRVFAKPVVRGLEAGYPLTDEERQVITEASSKRPEPESADAETV